MSFWAKAADFGSKAAGFGGKAAIKIGNFADNHVGLTRTAAGAVVGGVVGSGGGLIDGTGGSIGGWGGFLTGAAMGAFGGKVRGLRGHGIRSGLKAGSFLTGGKGHIGKRVGMQLGGSALPGAVLGTAAGLNFAGVGLAYNYLSSPGSSYGSNSMVRYGGNFGQQGFMNRPFNSGGRGF